MTRRVTLLASHMNVAQNGELQELPESELHDEIGQLIHSYNYMVQQQKMLMEEKYRLGESAKMAELRALQSQINPHFLYNTLDLVKWMAIKGDISEVEVTIKALADFYKCSLNQGKDVVTVAEELRHVRLYHQIQNLRFKQKSCYPLTYQKHFYAVKFPKLPFSPLWKMRFSTEFLEKNQNPDKYGLRAAKTEMRFCSVFRTTELACSRKKGTQCSPVRDTAMASETLWNACACFMETHFSLCATANSA